MFGFVGRVGRTPATTSLTNRPIRRSENGVSPLYTCSKINISIPIKTERFYTSHAVMAHAYMSLSLVGRPAWSSGIPISSGASCSGAIHAVEPVPNVEVASLRTCIMADTKKSVRRARC
jgi:hypothetical protein